MTSAESNVTVGDKVDRTVDEKSQKLSQILIAVKQLHQHQQEKELHAVGQQEGTGKEQHLMPDAVLLIARLKREYPIFTPNKVVNLRHDISNDIRRDVTFTLDMHQQPYHKRSNQSIERTYDSKTNDAYRLPLP